MFAPAPSLNGDYTVVGLKVRGGMDLMDKIKKGSNAQNGAVASPDRIVKARLSG